MDVLNKLKSAVSNVLPGNPLSRDFEIGNQMASTGPALLWKVFAAVKRTTKEEASVFLFEKKSVDRFSKRDRETVVDLLRGGVQQLTKLRHPKILAVIHPLEESREALAFATEPVFASLANVLGNVSNMSPLPKDLQDFQLYDVEIKHGLLQVTEGLNFLHHDAKIMFRNVCPEAIVLTKFGSWKLAGCEFCIHSSDPQSQDPSFPFREWRSDLVPVTQPNLDYMAPEYVRTMTCSPASDMFSLGMLVYTIFSKGKPFYDCHGDLSAFKNNAEELRHLRSSDLGAVPEELREHVKLLLNIEATVRPDASQLSKVPFFEDMGCMTLQYIDTLFQRENIEKSNFFKGLPKILAKLPKRVNLQRILPALFKEAMNHDMVPFLLPCILLVAEQSSDAEYQRQILPNIIPLFKLQEPIQILLLFLQNMNLLLSKTPKPDIQAHVLPMLFRALEADSPQIQELCLGIIPTFADLMDYPTLKNSLVPRIKKLCLGTSVLTVRVNSLLCIGQLMEYMDKWFVLDEILPFLQKIPTREPAVLMSMLGIHKVAFEDSKLGITKDAIANKILPFLIPIAIENNLNLTQFNAFMGVIRDMLNKMETEHRTKLEQLDQMKQEQRTLEISRISGQDGQMAAGDMNSSNKTPTMMDKFLSGVGLSALIGGQGQKAADVNAAQPSSTSLSSSQSNSPSASRPSPSATIPTAKKTNLSLEEKQRLALQQEQQQRLKSQTAVKLNPTPTSKSTGSVGIGSTSRPRDLTSTLMESNVAAMKTANIGTSGSVMSPAGGAWNSGPTWSGGNTGMGTGMNPTLPMYGNSPATNKGFGSSIPAFNSYQPSASGQGFGSSGVGVGLNPIGARNSPGVSGSGHQPKVDLSAFDSLLSSPQQQKPAMNQMTSNTGSLMSGGTNWPMSGSMIGMNQAVFNQANMGIQPMQPGLYGQGGLGGPMQGQFTGSNNHILSPASMNTSQKAANSLDDLFG